MVFNKSLPPPSLSKLYQIQNGIQANSPQLWRREGGSAAHFIDFICVTSSLFTKGVFFFFFFERVSAFLQLLVVQ